jgi:hypothetical protein
MTMNRRYQLSTAVRTPSRLVEIADFHRRWTDRSGNVREVPVWPPPELIDVILSMPAVERRLPPLQGVTEAPVLRPDGRVLLQPGYDRETRLFYAPSADLEGLNVPEAPSIEERIDAIELISESLIDFPFVDQASRAHAWAALFQPLIRPIVPIVPLIVLNAPQAGTGKTLFADVTFTVHTGAGLIATKAPSANSEEWNKLLTAQLMKGRSLIVFDNVIGRLESDALAAALTSSTFESRILGTSQVVHLPQRCTFMATGNNMMLSEDLTRRSLWIHLNAQTSNPYRRTGFRHPELIRWVRQNRRELLGALLTLIRSWYAEGCPAWEGPIIGGFEDYCKVVGGILSHICVEGFLGNFDAMFSQADPSIGQWEGFLDVLFDVYVPQGGREDHRATDQFTSRELLDRIRLNSSVRDALPDDLLDAVKRESPQLLAQQLNRIKSDTQQDRALADTPG